MEDRTSPPLVELQQHRSILPHARQRIPPQRRPLTAISSPLLRLPTTTITTTTSTSTYRSSRKEETSGVLRTHLRCPAACDGWLLPLLLLVVVPAATVASAEAAEVHAESIALLEIYHATNGPTEWPPSYVRVGWLNFTNTSHPCSVNNTKAIFVSPLWGVECDKYLGNVVKLAMTDLGCTGTLPEKALFALRSLVTFRWSSSQISGTLPQFSASTNPRLETIIMVSNLLTGTLPASWGTLRLLNISVRNNQLSGTLPGDAWATLTELSELHLHTNRLSGTLPASWGAGMQLVEEILIMRNELTGTLPPEWSRMASLKYLVGSANQFEGPVPEAWSQLPVLFGLELSDNRLTGPLPSKLNFGLFAITLSRNQITGTIPAAWSSAMPFLTLIYLDENRLTGTLPTRSWSTFLVLASLLLGGNSLSGPLPSEWHSLSKLSLLQLQQNDLTGIPPPSWPEGMKALSAETLRIEGNCLETRGIGEGGPPPPSGAAAWSWAQVSFGDRSVAHCGPQHPWTHTKTAWVTRTATLVLPTDDRHRAAPPAVTTGDAVTATLLAGPLGGLALGASVAAGAQRALLGLRLVQDCRPAGADEAVSFSDRPLPVVVGSCGAESGGASQHCGVVLGNVALLAAFAVAAGLYGVVRGRVVSTMGVGAALGLVGLPGRLLSVLVFVLQPTVSSSVWVLAYGGGSGAGVVLGLLGLSVLGASSAAVTVVVRRGVATYLTSRALGHRTEQGVLHWVVGPRVQWRAAPGRTRAAGLMFLRQYQNVFTKLRRGRHLYFVAGLASSAVCGVLGGLRPETEAGCEALRYLLLAVSLATLLAVLALRPFPLWTHQSLNVALELVGAVNAICVVARSATAVDVLSRIQLALCSVGFAMIALRLLYNRLTSRKSSEGTTNSTTKPSW